MEKKLAVIVDNNEEVTTEVADTEMCSSACDVAMETCSSESHDACGDGVSTVKKIKMIKKIKGDGYMKLDDTKVLLCENNISFEVAKYENEKEYW
jgi:hypothetical protein